MNDRRGLCLVACIATLGCQQVAAPVGDAIGGDPGNVALDSPRQRASYAQGFPLGQQGKAMPLDNEAFVAGVRDGLAGRESRLSPAATQEALAAFNDLVNEANAELAADNRAAGEAFLAQKRAT